MKITSEMIANIKYDGVGNIEVFQEPNSLKIKSDCNIKYYKIEGLKCSYHEVQQKIKENIEQLAHIESSQMCIPLSISKKYFGIACEPIEFCKINPEFQKNVKNPTLSATWKTNICSFFESFFVILHQGYKLFYLEIDPPREKLMKYFFENILKHNLIEAKAEDTITRNNLLQPTKVSIIFKSSDVNAAVQQIMESTNDPFNTTTSITSIYVQESCYNDLCEKLKLQLKPYPNDVLRDQFFIEEFNKHMKILKQLQPKLIMLDPSKSNFIVPTICCDFNRKYFQAECNSFSPIITLQSFRTIKECLGLLSENENISSKATIWSYNFAAAYEIIYKSNLYSLELNCCNITTYPFYKMFNHYAVPDSEHVDNNSGVLNTNSHHYQYFQFVQDNKIKFKTIIMAFGTTFAN